ncbi:MAG: nicotinate phosphoribosyltransferase [Candidatus Bipolaricaulia bacterium]
MALALFTDLYELTMAQAYLAEGLTDHAVFSLFVRRLPPQRNFLIACGLEAVLEYLESLRFTDEEIQYLASLGQFSQSFLEWLRHMRFTGDVYAVPEGTPVFAQEPILEIVAPLPQAQLVETFVMNQVHLQTVLASKAYRVVAAAQGRPVFDFAARRMHGSDAAIKGARAFYIAGVAATSNVLAGKLYKIPVVGTMAHSYIQAHPSELEAFRAFVRIYPQTVLLVDTYDTLAGVRRVIELARELGQAVTVKAIRLDSGDLLALSTQARQMLDAAGLSHVKILASGGLDEENITRLLDAGAPLDGFGVGTYMGVSKDAPDCDIVYKLTEYAGQGRLKLSPEKPILPGRKQVFRVEEGGCAVRDLIAQADEKLPGRPLLVPVMRGGERLEQRDLEAIRRYAHEQIERLPERIRALAPAQPPYPVELSPALQKLHQELSAQLERREAL